MSKFLGVNISEAERSILYNVVAPNMQPNSEKIYPSQQEMLHELIRGYDPQKALLALNSENDISETEMYSIIKKSINTKVPDVVRDLVSELKNKYKWTNRMIAFVFSHCAGKGKGFTNYTMTVARAWANEGVKTFEDMIKRTTKSK